MNIFNKSNKNILLIVLLVCFIIFMLGFTSATDYLPQKLNTNFDLVVQSNNASSCNLSYIQYPNGAKNYFNLPLTKNGQSFNITILNSNYTSLGDTCHGIVCSDGVNKEVGSICRSITPSGFINTFIFYIIVLVIIALVIILGFSIKEAWFVVIGGMALIMFGIYSINYGIADLRDMFMTWGIGLFEIAIGTILSIGAGWQKIEND